MDTLSSPLLPQKNPRWDVEEIGVESLLVIKAKSEQVLRWCAIEARFRLLQECNPLLSKWLKQRLTLRRSAGVAS
jgi:hypothetical protein